VQQLKGKGSGRAGLPRLALADSRADHAADPASRGDSVEPLDLRPHTGRALRGEGHASADAGRALSDAAPEDGDPASRVAPADADSDAFAVEAAGHHAVSGASAELLGHFRSAFAADPAAAYREWFRAQEELRGSGGDEEAGIARALADDLWDSLPAIPFPDPEARARFLHNLGVFFGSPGPAADLERSRRAFLEAAAFFEASSDEAWLARANHNFATSISNLASTAAEL